MSEKIKFEDECIPCRICYGTGIIPIPDHLAKTLYLLAEGEPLTAHQLLARFQERGIEPKLKFTALVNRLNILKELAYVETTGKGKKRSPFVWRVLD